uniref:Uncharacterized protein n=1 Tax=Rhizophagus irregularis (strain DAOM 181602 / DAOM 197198 / MUCL 43194) TaxID=747089 RepID=U9U2R2_RHIID
MEVIEIIDEEIYDVNKDAQNIQMLPTNIDSSSEKKKLFPVPFTSIFHIRNNTLFSR